jgi:hypothetical protein
LVTEAVFVAEFSVCEPLPRDGVVLGIQFHADIAAAEHLRGEQ